MCLEPKASLLKLSFQLVVVGQLAIVDDGNVRKGIRPERMRVCDIDLALGRKSYMSKPVCPVDL